MATSQRTSITLYTWFNVTILTIQSPPREKHSQNVRVIAVDTQLQQCTQKKSNFDCFIFQTFGTDFLREDTFSNRKNFQETLNVSSDQVKNLYPPPPPN